MRTPSAAQYSHPAHPEIINRYGLTKWDAGKIRPYINRFNRKAKTKIRRIRQAGRVGLYPRRTRKIRHKMTRSLTIRRNMHGETISSGVVAPCGGKYTGTAVALKSGNSCIRRVRMIIPAVPFSTSPQTRYMPPFFVRFKPMATRTKRTVIAGRQRPPHPIPILTV